VVKTAEGAVELINLDDEGTVPYLVSVFFFFLRKIVLFF